MADPIRILVVDDDVAHAEMVVQFLRATDAWSDATIDTAATYDRGLDALTQRRYDVALLDYWLGARDGLTLLREVRQRGVATPVVVLTGRGAEEVAVEAMKAGAADYLSKTNLSVEVLERTIRHALALRAEEAQRQQAEAALRASEERFRALVENSSDALVLLDHDGRITYTTLSSRRQLGWPPGAIDGRSILDVLHPDDRDPIGARLAEALQAPGAPITAEVRFQHVDGSYRTMEAVAVNRLADPSVRAVVVNARDITDRRRLEEHLRHVQKMEAVGVLAGGIAHDFNNLLTAILGYCNLLLDEVRETDPLRRDLEEIKTAGERAATLTRQLLAFSRKQILQPQIVDINVLLRQFEKLLRRVLGDAIELTTMLAPDLSPVKVDPSSIEQVLVNMAVNAKDAMPDGGRLTIETANVELDDGYTEADAAVVPGPYVMLAIRDTGQGIDAATRARIFDPFFTTKEVGKGTGLGLSSVFGIVKQSGGYIGVSSEPGCGTLFTIHFPTTQR